MKKLFTTAFLIICLNAFSQTKNDVADTLLYLHSIANNNFDELHPRHKERYEQLPQHILGADEITLFDDGTNGCILWLSYYKTNPLAPEVLKQTKKFFEKTAGNNGYTFRYNGKADRSVVEKDHIKQFMYYTPDLASEKELYSIWIYQTIPSLPAFADENTYHGKFPAAYDKKDSPQIVQVNGGNGPDSYMRFNGVFGTPGMLAGKLTMHGYGEFYDGIWISKNWHPADKGRIAAIFVPAKTTDSIYGELQDSTMRMFAPDERYSGYFKKDHYLVPENNPHWLDVCSANTLAIYKRQEDERAAAALKNAQPANITYSNNYDNPRQNNDRPARQYSTKERTCTRCNGSGRVMVTDSYGHSTSGFCSACNGTGKLSN